MKKLNYDIEFFRKDRRLSVTVDGGTRFEFSNSTQRILRRAKRYVKRQQRRMSPDIIGEQLKEVSL